MSAKSNPSPNHNALFGKVTAVMLVLMCFSVSAAQDGNPLPAPTGPYDVGVVWRHWVDEDRDEPYVHDTDAKREVIVQFLYPAEAAEGAEPVPYLDNAEEFLPVFATVMDAIAAVPVETSAADLKQFVSSAYSDAPISDDQESYPILIFSHGGPADVRMYTAQNEELASHGYIVASINHTYGSSHTVLLDGTVAIPTFETGLEGAAVVWSQDQIFVMDQLEALNVDDSEGNLTGRLDLERLGVFGHSLGGTASTLTCWVDSRCKATVNGDGPVYGDVIAEGIDQPIMYLLSDGRIFSDPAFYDNARGSFYAVHAGGFEHLDFSDFALWPNIQSVIDVDWLGGVEPGRAIEITRTAIRTFFDIYLKGDPDASLDVLSAYPEVEVVTREAGTGE